MTIILNHHRSGVIKIRMIGSSSRIFTTQRETIIVPWTRLEYFSDRIVELEQRLRLIERFVFDTYSCVLHALAILKISRKLNENHQNSFLIKSLP